MKIEQGVCGLILLGVVAVANGRHLRAAFARERPPGRPATIPVAARFPA